MKVYVHPSVVDELNDAAKFYADRAEQALGLAFIAEFERALNLLSVSPELGANWRGTAKRFSLRRFPYNLVYQFKPDEIRIIALAHQRRQPSYWKSRS